MRSAYRRRGVPIKRCQNPFLPADDEANVHGYWVPSPEDIEAQKKAIREANAAAGKAYDLKSDYVNHGAAVPVRKHAFE